MIGFPKRWDGRVGPLVVTGNSAVTITSTTTSPFDVLGTVYLPVGQLNSTLSVLRVYGDWSGTIELVGYNGYVIATSTFDTGTEASHEVQFDADAIVPEDGLYYWRGTQANASAAALLSWHLEVRYLPWTFTKAESALLLPDTAVWFSQNGVTVSTGVSQWDSSYGGLVASVAQATGSQQPAYSASGGAGGRPVITGDGVDDILSDAMYAYVTSSIELGVVLHAYSDSSNNARLISRGVGPSSAYINQRIDGTVRAASPVAQATSIVPPSGAQHFSGDSDGSTATNIRLNGVAAATTTADAIALSDRLDIFGYPATGYYASCSMQAAYIGSKLTDEQRTYLRYLLWAKTGIPS